MNEPNPWVTIGVTYILMLLVAFPIALIAAIPTIIAWNIGITGAATALGAHVSNISYWTAVGLCFVIREARALVMQNPHNVSLEMKK